MQSQFEDAANAVAYKFRPPNDQVDAPKPTARHSFIHERLRRPPALGRGPARVVAGRAGEARGRGV